MENKNVQNIAIIGSGFMGARIALRNAMYGYNISMYDISVDALDQAKEMHEKELSSRIENNTVSKQEKKKILDRITYSTSLSEAVSDTDLVIEAIPENIELKRKIFKDKSRNEI